MFKKSLVAVAILGAFTLSANSATVEEVRVIATTAQNNVAHALIQNSTPNKTQIDQNAQDIAANKAEIGKIEHIHGTQIKDLQSQQIENTDAINTNKNNIAANKTQIEQNKQNIADNTQAIANNYREMKNNFAAVNSRIDNLDEEMKKGFASQAALNGLFQPYNVGKFNLSVALGGYESEQAMALGTGYRFNENFAMKAGIATDVGGFDHLTYNVGANFEW